MLYPKISGLSQPMKNPKSGTREVTVTRPNETLIHWKGVSLYLYTTKPPTNVPREAEAMFIEPARNIQC